MKSSTFQRGTGVYICHLCQKRTRETTSESAGVDLCEDCYEVAGYENQHSDSDHAGILQDCAICLDEMGERYAAHCKAHPDLFR